MPFNWLYARRNGGTVILRIDDTDVERNTEASLASIFEGLRWLDLAWDEEHKQSERLGLNRAMTEAIFQKGLAYRDFVPAQASEGEKSGVTVLSKPCGPVISTRTPPPKGSAAIQPSYG